MEQSPEGLNEFAWRKDGDPASFKELKVRKIARDEHLNGRADRHFREWDVPRIRKAFWRQWGSNDVLTIKPNVIEQGFDLHPRKTELGP